MYGTITIDVSGMPKPFPSIPCPNGARVTAAFTNSARVQVGLGQNSGYSLAPVTPSQQGPGANCSVSFPALRDLGDLFLTGAAGDLASYEIY